MSQQMKNDSTHEVSRVLLIMDSRFDGIFAKTNKLEKNMLLFKICQAIKTTIFPLTNDSPSHARQQSIPYTHW